MVLFMVVQYNDPDGLTWILIYAVPAIWSGLAFFRPALFDAVLARRTWGVTLLAALAGMVYYWPKTPQWWASEVWWETETAREGMGMMIVVVALVLTRLCARRG